eukprot:12777862-Alexandrium_andersonii.AAC.1
MASVQHLRLGPRESLPSDWLPARQSPRSARIGRSADCGLEFVTFRFLDLGPLGSPTSWANSESARAAAQNAPLASSGGPTWGLSWARAVP